MLILTKFGIIFGGLNKSQLSKLLKIHFLLSLCCITLLTYCSDCLDCGVVNNEPVVEVRFFSKVDSLSLKVRIESLNGVPGSDLSLIGDELSNTFPFPINMNDDLSVFAIHSFKETDTLEIDLQQDSLGLAYTTSVFKTEGNFLRLKADNLQLISHTFDSVALFCENSDCSNDEVSIRIFY